MANQVGLTQNVTIKPTISLEMQFSMKILQMSSGDLKSLIYDEFVENPVLEIDEYDMLPSEEVETRVSPPKNEFIFDEPFHYDIEPEPSPLDFISKKKTFTDNLLEQIGYLNLSFTKSRICKHIIYSLDDRGYFKEDYTKVALQLRVDFPVFLEALQVIRHLEPTGIGWSTLEDSLIYQLEVKNLMTENHRAIINHHLEKIAKGNYHDLSQELKISEMAIRKIAEDIKGLNPIPSRGFSKNEKNNYILPDASIIKFNERLIISMNTQLFPQLKIDLEMLKIIEKDESNLSHYLKGKVEDAKMMIRSLEMRKSTLEKVIEMITDHQHDYLMEIKNFLQPLSIKDVAESLAVNESTISRAVSEKYVSTPRGTLPLKELFSTKISKGNRTVSSDYITNLMMDLIKEEDKRKPLSDQKIAEALNEKGIEIKRRTVAKYRDDVGIPSTKIRREV